MRGTKRGGALRAGFTLIELLAVISIIGFLASIVLAALSASRDKGRDTRVTSDIRQLQTQIQADATGNLYDASFQVGVAGVCGNATNLNCPLITTGNYPTLTTDITTVGGVFSVVTTRASGHVTAYALYGRLVSDTTKYFCVDSQGRTNPSTARDIASSICP